MPEDLAERLEHHSCEEHVDGGLLHEGAEEIKRLRGEIELLQRYIMGGTRCHFVGVPCGNCVGCHSDRDVFEVF